MALNPIQLQPSNPWQATLGVATTIVLLLISFTIPSLWQQLIYALSLLVFIMGVVLVRAHRNARIPRYVVFFELVELASFIISTLGVFYIVAYGTIPTLLVFGALTTMIVHTFCTFRLVLAYYIDADGRVLRGNMLELAIDVTIFMLTLIWLANFEMYDPLSLLGLPLVPGLVLIGKEVVFATSYLLLVMQVEKTNVSTISAFIVSWVPLGALITSKFEYQISINSWSMAIQIMLLAALLRFCTEFFPSRTDIYVPRLTTKHMEYVRVYLMTFIVVGLLLYFVFNYASIGLANMLPQLLVTIALIAVRTWMLVTTKSNEQIVAAQIEEDLLTGLTKDELTGIPNRIAIEQFVSAQMARTDQVDRYIITIDIDGFKLVNESLGHATGDEVLLLITQRIAKVAERALFFGRLASDKFVVIIESGEEQVEKLANDYLTAIIDSYTLADGEEIRIGCSAGVSLINPKVDLHTNMELADAAITEAKFIGRGTVASRSLSARGPQVNKVVRDAFAKAVQAKDFGLRWIPKVNLKTGDIVGNAGHLFWHANPTLTVKQLHELADEDRLARDLTALELELGCAVIAKTQQPLTLGLRGQDLLDTELPEHILRLSSQYNIGLSEIEFMLIDRAKLSKDSHTDIAVENLHNLGITITLSEFGSGFFSMAQMKSIEVDAISVDESVISQVLTDSKLSTILEGIVIAANGMSLPVTAVGIESERIAETVSAAGCIFGIGPWFGRQSTIIYAEAESLRRSALIPSSSYPLVGDFS